MTGYRAFSYQFVKSFPVLSKGFEIETEMSIHAIDKNMALDNEIIEYRDRPAGSESKLNKYTDGVKVLWTILKLFKNYRPLVFFGTVATILSMLSLTFFIPVLIDFLTTGIVERFPTLIVCGFVMIAAIQSFFTGLMLETMKQKNRQDFELELIHISEKYIALKGQKESES